MNKITNLRNKVAVFIRKTADLATHKHFYYQKGFSKYWRAWYSYTSKNHVVLIIDMEEV